MKILAVGDVIGRPGRTALESGLSWARDQFSPDFVIVNGENASGGFGLTRKVFDHFVESLRVDCVTTGNHWMDKREIYNFMDHDRLVLPANMSNVDDSKQGFRIIAAGNNVQIAVINLIGKVFMKGENRSPFDALDRIYEKIPSYVKVRIIDVHAEATSEKQAIAQYMSGRASVVYGTHSHVPTADLRILKDYTGFVTDLGMTGPYDSVIGIETSAAIKRMRTGEKKNFEPAQNDLVFYGCLFNVNPATGACDHVERLRFEAKPG